jgi:hypothetical protein
MKKKNDENEEDEARVVGSNPGGVNVLASFAIAARQSYETETTAEGVCWRMRTSASANSFPAAAYVGSGRTPPRVGVSLAESSPGISPGMSPSPFALASPSASPSALGRIACSGTFFPSKYTTSRMPDWITSFAHSLHGYIVTYSVAPTKF